VGVETRPSIFPPRPFHYVDRSLAAFRPISPKRPPFAFFSRPNFFSHFLPSGVLLLIGMLVRSVPVFDLSPDPPVSHDQPRGCHPILNFFPPTFCGPFVYHAAPTAFFPRGVRWSFPTCSRADGTYLVFSTHAFPNRSTVAPNGSFFLGKRFFPPLHLFFSRDPGSRAFQLATAQYSPGSWCCFGASTPVHYHFPPLCMPARVFYVRGPPHPNSIASPCTAGSLFSASFLIPRQAFGARWFLVPPSLILPARLFYLRGAFLSFLPIPLPFPLFLFASFPSSSLQSMLPC